MNADYTIALVVDPVFGARLSEIAGRMPVWIVDTPEHRPLVERYWAEHPAAPHTKGVTIFKADASKAPEEWCIGELSAIDLHVGELSHDPPYGAIEVYGLEANARIVATLAEYRLCQVAATREGFRAEKGRRTGPWLDRSRSQ